MHDSERQSLRRRREWPEGNVEKPNTRLRVKPKAGRCWRCLEFVDDWLWPCLLGIFLLVVFTLLYGFLIFTRVCPKLDTKGEGYFKFGRGQPFAFQDEEYRTLVKTGDWTELPSGLSVAAVVSSHNNQPNIPEIVLPLKASGLLQTIVAVDNKFGNLNRALWNDYLTEKQQFTIRTNGVRQLTAYNMGSRLVQDADIMVFLHDEDLLPLNDHWISNALSLFDEYKELGVLSGYGGEITKGMEFGEEETTTKSTTYKIPTISSARVPFMWTVTAWAAPLFIRRSLFKDLNGFDEEMGGKQEELVIWFDEEFCLRAEKEKGMFSGIYPARGFKRKAGGGQLLQWAFRRKVNAMKRDREYIQKKYGSVWGEQAQRIRRKIMELDRRKLPSDAVEEYKTSLRVLSIT